MRERERKRERERERERERDWNNLSVWIDRKTQGASVSLNK